MALLNLLGENAFEEFYVPDEEINIQRFQAFGVVDQTTRYDIKELNALYNKLEGIF